MAPHRLMQAAQMPLNPIAAAWAAVVAALYTEAHVILFGVWVLFVFLDFALRWVEIAAYHPRDWSGRRAVQGFAKKIGYFGGLIVVAGIEQAAGVVHVAIPELAAVTKLALVVLVAIEAGSVVKNAHKLTGDAAFTNFLRYVVDTLRAAASGQSTGKRWGESDLDSEEGEDQ